MYVRSNWSGSYHSCVPQSLSSDQLVCKTPVDYFRNLPCPSAKHLKLRFHPQKPLKMVKIGPFEARFSVDGNIVDEYQDNAFHPRSRKKEALVYVEATSGASFKVHFNVHKD